MNAAKFPFNCFWSLVGHLGRKVILIDLFVVFVNGKQSLLMISFTPLSGDAPSDRSSDGAEDEPAPIQSAQHAAWSSTPQQIVASKYSRVSSQVIEQAKTTGLSHNTNNKLRKNR